MSLETQREIQASRDSINYLLEYPSAKRKIPRLAHEVVRLVVNNAKNLYENVRPERGEEKSAHAGTVIVREVVDSTEPSEPLEQLGDKQD